jgi:hypothetical protein
MRISLSNCKAITATCPPVTRNHKIDHDDNNLKANDQLSKEQPRTKLRNKQQPSNKT